MPGPAPIVACFIREGVCMCCVYPVCPVYTNSIRLYSSHCTVGKSWDSWESYFSFTINFHTLECFKYTMEKKRRWFEWKTIPVLSQGFVCVARAAYSPPSCVLACYWSTVPQTTTQLGREKTALHKVQQHKRTVVLCLFSMSKPLLCTFWHD